MLLTLISIVVIPLITFALLSLYVRRALPRILEDVGLSVSDQINEKIQGTFAEPNVKRAFSILAKQSGAVRANDALRSKAADKLLEGVPSIGFILDQLDMTPTEGLQLLNDPLIGPVIQNFIKSGGKNLWANFTSKHSSASSGEKGHSPYG